MYRRRGNLPFVPQPSALTALRYLDTNDEFIPLPIEQAFASVDLSFYLFGQPPPGFWKGARLDDPDWRRQHMKPGIIPKPLPINTKRLLVLMELVLSNGLKPHNVEESSVEEPSEDQDLPATKHSMEDEPLGPEEDGFTRSTFAHDGSSTGETLSSTMSSKR